MGVGLSVGVGAKLSPFDRREVLALVRLRMYLGLLGDLGVWGL